MFADFISAENVQKHSRRTRRILCAAFSVLVVVFCIGFGHAQNLVLLHGKQSHELEEQQIQELANFYGVGLVTEDTGSPGGISQAMQRVAAPDTLAVLAAEDALDKSDTARLRTALRRRGRASVPLLIFGITAEGDADTLKAWSAGSVSGCAAQAERGDPATIHVEQNASLAGVLAGRDLAAATTPACRIDQAAANSVVVLAARWAGGGSIPLLVRAQAGEQDVYFVPQLRLFDTSFLGAPWGMEKSFSSLAPFLIFLKPAVGNYGWHLDGHYANFTIDDPWLVEPYGALNYRGLLQQMEQHNFHTTIAFIPWNYDRSRADVIAMFRAHPDRYSISIHGDNHTHREFGSYGVNPLDEQVREIRQSVARMDRFHELTGIPYDRVMVFPHGVSPLQTFAALRTYGFLGTVNSLDVPLGEPFPTSSTFLLRPYTTGYAGLLSMSRMSVAVPIPDADLAIQVFLGNPLMFYAHHDLFEHGIGAFNHVADTVNRMQQDTTWAGLGEIARHTYPIRQRMDGGYDVRMLAPEIDLTNPGENEAVFHVAAPEGLQPEATVSVDGASVVFEREATGATLLLTIAPHQTKKIRIALDNGFDPGREDIRRRSVYAYVLRRLSDVRDMDLSRFRWGRAMVAGYYGDKADGWELAIEHRWWLVLLCVSLIGVLYLRRRRKQRGARNAGDER